MDYTQKSTGHIRDGIQTLKLVTNSDSKEAKQPSTKMLGLVDMILSVFVITPLVVFSWRGSWGYMDLHQAIYPYLESFLIGMFVHTVLAVGQDKLHTILIECDKHWSLHILVQILRRFYTYVFLMATLFHWRGGWGLIDQISNVQFNGEIARKEGSHWVLILWATSFALLVTIKGLRNAIAPPFAICTDKGNYVFRFPTMFQHKSQNSLPLAVLDCAFSVGILGNLVVTFWRGLWIVLDISLWPNDVLSSAWTSLFLGVVVTGLVFRLQNRMQKLCSQYSGLSKIILADSYILLSCIATLLYWRGLWILCNIYFLPNTLELSCITSHLGGFTFLVLLNCSNSLLVRGVYKDGKEANGESVVFPVAYLRILLDKKNEFKNDCENDSEKMLTYAEVEVV